MLKLPIEQDYNDKNQKCGGIVKLEDLTIPLFNYYLQNINIKTHYSGHANVFVYLCNKEKYVIDTIKLDDEFCKAGEGSLDVHIVNTEVKFHHDDYKFHSSHIIKYIRIKLVEDGGNVISDVIGTIDIKCPEALSYHKLPPIVNGAQNLSDYIGNKLYNHIQYTKYHYSEMIKIIVKCKIIDIHISNGIGTKFKVLCTKNSINTALDELRSCLSLNLIEQVCEYNRKKCNDGFKITTTKNIEYCNDFIQLINAGKVESGNEDDEYTHQFEINTDIIDIEKISILSKPSKDEKNPSFILFKTDEGKLSICTYPNTFNRD